MNGPLAGQDVSVGSGTAVTFGRDESANIPISWDAHISRRHFQVAQEGEECVLTDLRSSNGTMLNQQRVERAVLADGDIVSAGSTHLRVRDGEKVTPYEYVIEVLRSGASPLFAVMDAARDPQILPMLHNSGEPHQSLFEKGEQSADAAPYLVQFTGQDPLLDSLVYSGWGKGWGIFLNCGQPLAEVLRQLRRWLNSRYYDPRICSTWLPKLTPQEAAEFYGGIELFSVEGEKPGVVIRYRRSPRGVDVQTIKR